VESCGGRSRDILGGAESWHFLLRMLGDNAPEEEADREDS